MLHHISFRQKVIVMVAVMSGLFLVALDQTIIATALAKIVEDFNSFSSLSWIVTAYLLTSTVTVPIAGKLSDIFGRRSVLMIGVGLFGLSSLLSGSAQSMEQLIAFRALQGVGGGIIMANAFTIVGDLFSPRERAKWQGLIGAVFGIASVIGPLLGGFLTDPHHILGIITNWRYTFWINVPIAVVSFIMIARYTPTIRHDHKPKIDYAGAAAIAVSLVSLILVVSSPETVFASLVDKGVSLSTLKITLYAIAAVAAAVFIWIESRADEPIIPLRFFKNRTFATIMTIALLFGAAFLGAILYLTQFNQQVFGASATQAGLMLLPMIGGLSITSALTGQVVTRTGKYKGIIIAGFTIATIGVLSLSTLGPTSPYWHEAIIMAFVGIGLGSGMPIMNLAVQNEFEQRDLGAATASSQLFRGLGSTIGTAVLGGILTAGVTAGLGNLNNDAYIHTLKSQPASSQQLQTVDANTALNLNTVQEQTAITNGLQKSLATLKLPALAKQKIVDDFTTKQDAFSSKVKYAFSDSLHAIFYTSAALMGAATIGAFFIRERPLRGGHDDTPGVA